MFLSKFIILFLSLSSLASYAGVDKARLVEKMHILTQMTSVYMEVCSIPDGKGPGAFKENEIFTNLGGSLEDGNLDCNDQLMALDKYRKSLEKETAALELEISKDPTCDPSDLKEGNLANLLKQVDDAQAISEKMQLSCEWDNTQTGKSCAEDFGCNMMSMFMDHDPAKPRYKSNGQLCVQSTNSCIMNFDMGIIKSVGGFFSFVGDGITWAVDRTGRAYKHVNYDMWKKAHPQEDASATQVQILQEADYKTMEAIGRFSRGLPDSARDLGVKIWNSMNEGIRNSYGCQKWSGTPYASECLKPIEDFCGASCSMKMNTICGLVGHMGGEILNTLITGSVTAPLFFTAQNISGRLIQKMGLEPYIERLAKVRKQSVLKTKIAGLVVLDHMKMTLKELPALKAISNAVAKLGGRLSKPLEDVTRNTRTTGNITGQGRVAIYQDGALYKPIKNYLELSKEAARLGGVQSDSMLVAMNNGRNRMAHALFDTIPKEHPVGTRLMQNRDGKYWFLDKKEIPFTPSDAFSQIGIYSPAKARVMKLNQADLKLVSNAVGKNVNDPDKYRYIVDELTGLDKLTAVQKKKKLDEVIKKVNNWKPNSLTVRVAEFRQKRFLASVEKYKKEFKKQNPEMNDATIARYAERAALDKKDRAIALQRACTTLTPNSTMAKAGALYGSANMSLGLTTTAGTYAYANWNKVKDTEWAKRLGYEVVMAYLISKWSSKISTSQSDTFLGKVASSHLVSLKVVLIESSAYSMFFSNDAKNAKDHLAKLEKSPNFAADVKELETYVNERSGIQELVDGVGDMSNNLMRYVTGKELLNDMSAEEIGKLNPDALKDPMVMERLMDDVADKIYSDNLDGNTYGSKFIDRIIFDTEWNLYSVPRNVAVGALTYQAVCRNINNPAMAIGAFMSIQTANKVGSSYYYYRKKAKEIKQ